MNLKMSIMKGKIKLRIFLLSFLLSITVSFSYSQNSLPISGKYNVISGSTINQFEIIDNQVLGYENGLLVERFFLYAVEVDYYVLEKVALDLITYETITPKDRILIRVNLTDINANKKKMNITYPWGGSQEILIQK